MVDYFYSIIRDMLDYFIPVHAVADPEFYNGGRTVEGDGSGERLFPLPRKKMNFYLKQMGFGAF